MALMMTSPVTPKLLRQGPHFDHGQSALSFSSRFRSLVLVWCHPPENFLYFTLGFGFINKVQADINLLRSQG